MSESSERQLKEARDPGVHDQSSGEHFEDTRSPTAKAMAWVSSITTISVMMVMPAFAGYYLDQYFGTVALFLFLGMLLGVGSSAWQLYKLVQYKNLMLEQEMSNRDRAGKSELETRVGKS